MSTRIAITGASGLIGTALATSLRADGHTVLAIGRGGASDIVWDPARGSIDRARLDGVTAVVHLAGANVGERWTAAHKRAIVESRVDGTRMIAEAMAALAMPPRVLVSASAIGIYGNRGDTWLDESASSGDDFLASVAVRWERAADPARAAGIRTVHPRIGVALTPEGGALAKMLPAFRLGGGAVLGSGDQWMSWITLPDVVAALRHLIDRDDIAGPVNVVAPEPVTNRTFTRALADELHAPRFLPAVPRVALRALFGEMAEGTLLASQRVRPHVLARSGFTHAHPTLVGALAALLG